MDDSERLGKLEQARERNDRWFAEHISELEEIRKDAERDRATIAEIRKSQEDQMDLLADPEGLILANQRRIKNALIHWDLQRHGYPEGGNPPTE